MHPLHARRRFARSPLSSRYNSCQTEGTVTTCCGRRRERTKTRRCLSSPRRTNCIISACVQKRASKCSLQVVIGQTYDRLTTPCPWIGTMIRLTKSVRHNEIRLSLTQFCGVNKAPLQLLGSVHCAPHALGVNSLPHAQLQCSILSPSHLTIRLACHPTRHCPNMIDQSPDFSRLVCSAHWHTFEAPVSAVLQKLELIRVRRLVLPPAVRSLLPQKFSHLPGSIWPTFYWL